MYPILGSDATVVATRGPAEWGGTWRGTKVLWFVHQRYRGHVLIRGGRLGGWERLRFDSGAVPSDEIRIAAGPSPARWRDQPPGSRGRPSYIRVRAGGCYGVQIDGTTFSRTVVFRVRFGRRSTSSSRFSARRRSTTYGDGTLASTSRTARRRWERASRRARTESASSRTT